MRSCSPLSRLPVAPVNRSIFVAIETLFSLSGSAFLSFSIGFGWSVGWVLVGVLDGGVLGCFGPDVEGVLAAPCVILGPGSITVAGLILGTAGAGDGAGVLIAAVDVGVVFRTLVVGLVVPVVPFVLDAVPWLIAGLGS